MKSTSFLLLTLFLFSMSILYAVEIPSLMPEIKRVDDVFANAAMGRKNQGVEEEGKILIDAWKITAENEEDTDAVGLRLAEFARHRPQLKQELLDHCTRQQLIRLADKCANKYDYRGVLMFAGEFRNKYPSDEDYPRVSNMCAKALMLTDANDKRALEIWESVKNKYAETEEGKIAALCIEAVKGPESIAGLEMASRIGILQSQAVDNPYRALFFHWRVLKASKKDFFTEFVNNEEAPEADRAELIYIVLEHAHLAAKYDMVPELAGQVFTLVNYESDVSVKSAFAIPVSHFMRGRHDEAIAGFENFLRTWPHAPDASKASLYLGQALEAQGRKQEAVLQYAITMEKYKNSSAALEAKVYYETLLNHDKDGKLLAAINNNKAERLAFFEKSLDPSLTWQKCQLPRMEEKKTAQIETPKEDGRRFVRLARVLNNLEH